MTSIKSMMKTNVMSVGVDDSIGLAVHKMAERNMGAVLVLNQDGTLFGIFTERDLLMRVVAAGIELKSRVGNVATQQVQTVSETTEVLACYKLIKERGFRHLPIVNSASEPVGIISSRDFLDELVSRMEPFTDMTEFCQDFGNQPLFGGIDALR